VFSIVIENALKTNKCVKINVSAVLNDIRNCALTLYVPCINLNCILPAQVEMIGSVFYGSVFMVMYVHLSNMWLVFFFEVFFMFNLKFIYLLLKFVLDFYVI